MAVLMLMALVTAALLSLNYLHSVVRWYDERTPVRTGPSAGIVQVYCLDYTRYVIDEYRAGLAVDRIDATLKQAARAGEQLHAQGLRLDDPKACGTADTILRAAGLK
ncbi:hypothetical protein D5S18_08220 [Nocardia panacis]|uniref:Uncharacterized protein n=2 Tax=Nocardia panacis TaxID=2340916 RepID=A0A3A4KPL4_9NOCA|nr:hypothetical protein D5S18_08220 [Nocardia panacis]